MPFTFAPHACHDMPLWDCLLCWRTAVWSLFPKDRPTWTIKQSPFSFLLLSNEPFQTMKGPPKHTGLVNNALPWCHNCASQIPFDKQVATKAQLHNMESKGIIEETPEGELFISRHPIVVVAQKNSSESHITADLSASKSKWRDHDTHVAHLPSSDSHQIWRELFTTSGLMPWILADPSW